jgi:hypothetical protein
MREELVALRPIIETIRTTDVSPIEQFQNECLRPIIKMQHDVLIALVKSQPNFDEILHRKGSSQQFQDKIRTFIVKQPSLKHLFIGMVVGMFTADEMKTYSKHATDFNKRISGMICQRISDTFY